jgi:hypothetical protein
MSNSTLPALGNEGITSATYGPVAAAMVLFTPLVFIFSVTGVLVHHKLYGKKQPIAYELSAIQDQPLAKKKRKAHRGRRHSKQISAMAVITKYEELDVKKVLEKAPEEKLAEEKKETEKEAEQEGEKSTQGKTRSVKLRGMLRKPTSN